MHGIRPWLSKLRLFHWCLIVLIPLGIFVAGLRLNAFPRTNWAIRRAIALTVGPRLNLARNLDPARSRLRDAAGSKISMPLKDPRIVITKSSRRAELYSGAKLIKRYKIVLGQDPQEHKTLRGDSRTPEGQYRICTCLYRSTFHIFLGLNYPNARDAEQGSKNHVIKENDALRLSESERKHRKPSWNTAIGGAIGLHGGGTAADWTAGCIAFDNNAIEELCLATGYWTPVEIRP